MNFQSIYNNQNYQNILNIASRIDRERSASPQPIANRAAGNWCGSGTCQFADTGSGIIMKKETFWTTIGIHGTEWWLFITRRVIQGREGAPTYPPESYLSLVKDSLREVISE
jgi:hypothetical protein